MAADFEILWRELDLTVELKGEVGEARRRQLAKRIFSFVREKHTKLEKLVMVARINRLAFNPFSVIENRRDIEFMSLLSSLKHLEIRCEDLPETLASLTCASCLTKLLLVGVGMADMQLALTTSYGNEDHRLLSNIDVETSGSFPAFMQFGVENAVEEQSTTNIMELWNREDKAWARIQSYERYRPDELETLTGTSDDGFVISAVPDVGDHHSPPWLSWLDARHRRGKSCKLSMPKLRKLTLAFNQVSHRIYIDAPNLEDIELINVSGLTWHFLSECLMLSRLRLCVCHNADQVVLSLLSQGSQKHRPIDLHIEASNCSAMMFEIVGKNCPGIEKLTLTRISFSEGIVFDRSMFARWRDLRVLDISNCLNFFPDGLAIAVASLPALEHLILGGMVGYNLTLQSATLLSLQIVTPLVLQELEVACPLLVSFNCRARDNSNRKYFRIRSLAISSSQLRELKLVGCHQLAALRLRCPLLQELELQNCSTPSQGPFELFSGIGACLRLKKISLNDVQNFEEVVLRDFDGLEVMQVFSCHHLRRLSIGCQRLRKLQLSRCEKLTYINVHAVRLSCMEMQDCWDLEWLCLRADTDRLVVRGCTRLSKLELHCPNLLHIDAYMCSSLQDSCLKFCGTDSCPRLEFLEIGMCESITPEGWQALDKLRSLRRLEISFCPQLDNLSYIARVCQGLTYLKLSSLASMSPIDVLGMLRKLEPPRLTHLCLSYLSGPRGTIEAASWSDAIKLACNALHLTTLELVDLQATGDECVFELNGPCSAMFSLRELILRKGKGFDAICIGTETGGADTQLLITPIRDFTSPFHNLRVFTMGSFSVCSLALALPHLEVCKIEFCTSLEMISLITPSLRKLSFRSCNRLKLKTVCDTLRHCRLLQTLVFHLCGRDVERGTRKLSDVESIRQYCPSLTKVEL